MTESIKDVLLIGHYWVCMYVCVRPLEGVLLFGLGGYILMERLATRL